MSWTSSPSVSIFLNPELCLLDCHHKSLNLEILGAFRYAIEYFWNHGSRNMECNNIERDVQQLQG